MEKLRPIPFWVIVYINISSGGIKWHQNSNVFYRFSRWVVWVDIIWNLSFDGFGHFLVFLYTIWRTTTKITQKVIVLEQKLTILTYAYCVAIVSTYDEDQRYQRSSKGQQRMEKIQAWKRSENSVMPAVQTSYWCELAIVYLTGHVWFGARVDVGTNLFLSPAFRSH